MAVRPGLPETRSFPSSRSKGSSRIVALVRRDVALVILDIAIVAAAYLAALLGLSF